VTGFPRDSVRSLHSVALPAAISYKLLVGGLCGVSSVGLGFPEFGTVFGDADVVGSEYPHHIDQVAVVKQSGFFKILRRKMGEDKFPLDEQFVPAMSRYAYDGTAVPQRFDCRTINQKIARNGFRLVKENFGNLGQHDFRLVASRFADEQAAGLRQTFDDERTRHDGMVLEMIVHVIFGKRNRFNRFRSFMAFKNRKPIDPIPVHYELRITN